MALRSSEAAVGDQTLDLLALITWPAVSHMLTWSAKAAAARSGGPAMYMSSAMARMSRSGYLSRRSARILRVSRQYKKLPQAQPCMVPHSDTMS